MLRLAYELKLSAMIKYGSGTCLDYLIHSIRPGLFLAMCFNSHLF